MAGTGVLVGSNAIDTRSAHAQSPATYSEDNKEETDALVGCLLSLSQKLRTCLTNVVQIQALL